MSAGTDVDATEFHEIAPADCVFSPHNRKVDETSESFLSLVESVRGAGVAEPIGVRLHPKKEGKFEVFSGERRVRAARKVGLATVAANVYLAMSDEQFMLRLALANLERENLTPMEEGRLVAEMLKTFRDDAKAVAGELGRSERWVRLRARLTKLSPTWQEELRDDDSEISRWSAGHLELIARLPEDVQEDLLKNQQLAYSWRNHRQSVLSVASDLADRERSLRQAPWRLDDETLSRKAGACLACLKRTSCQGKLFVEADESPEDVNKHDRCLDPRCWERKRRAHVKRTLALAREKNPGAPLVAETWGSRSKTILTPGDYEDAKEGDKGAVCAIVADDAHAGQIKWVKLKRTAPWGTADDSGKPTPEAKLKRLRADLKHARERWVVQQVKNRVAKGQGTPPEDRIVIAFAATVGVRSGSYDVARDWRQFKALSKKDDAAAMTALRKAVRQQIGDSYEMNVELCAATFGLDLADLRKQARTKVKPPKELVALEKELAAAKTGKEPTA